MGWFKEKMIEFEESGNWPSSELSDKYVCVHHFTDRYLNKIIRIHGEQGKCSYCRRKGVVCDMERFGQEIAFKIDLYYTDIDKANLMLADGFYDDDDEVIPGFRRIGDYVAPEENTYYDTKQEMLYDLGLCTDDDDLNKDIESIFTTEQWISKDIYEENKTVRYANQWDRFVDFVTKKRRFTFLASPEYLPIIQEKNGNQEDILSVLNSLINEEELVVSLKEGTKLYRARKVDDISKDYEFEDVTSPPDTSAFPNRMSPAGISMFYASFEKDTAMKECVGENNKGIIVGEFETIRDLRVIDFANIPNSSFWMSNWQGNQFLHHFNDSITERIDPKDTNHLQYVPTQVFTEYLRYMFKDKMELSIDGMIYGSSKTNERNIVLFCNQKESKEYVNTDVRMEKYISENVWKLIG